ncbi:GyrI-like domain-containing protein [Cellulosilyticum sp. ST5]|uniref:Transcription activator effector binding protein n=1 Tax=Cellulosilyticum lentocellum (strain ATCC 49066 / DSM 5427 / NCIMB 11756 / RHM5) TaxID=642492 RepID=F2JJU3_CELLD|nr:MULTISPECIES: GyrI-like domain-containing protein [Cellulosilyticum]ADZ83225.1 transcription activator effector binding protein [Cellulosilyticum lentocellum DSM 5427]QEH68705.1 GyrI-like domain-containing protein [Cellulosilyticum sp. WCF-2]
MANLEVNVEYIEQQTIYGLWQKSNDKTISKDIKSLSQKYHMAVSVPEGEVLPYFVLSRNYDEQSNNFEMFIGSTFDKDGLETFILPASEYAKITVKPKLGFLWGASIGEAKRYFYTKWLPKNSYEALNMEYEYHTEKSTGNQPTIDIIFAIQRKS